MEQLKKEIEELKKEMKKWRTVFIERDNAIRDDLIKLEQEVLILREELKEVRRQG